MSSTINSRLACHSSVKSKYFTKVHGKSGISTYFIALRPWSFTISMTPVALGSCLAYKSSEKFDILVFILTCLTALFVHAAGNLVNTYFDFMKGVDGKKSDDRTLVDEILAPNKVATLGAGFYIFGCVGFYLLVMLTNSQMEHLAFIYFCGLSGSFLYTGGLGLKYIALGDLLIFFTFGPITVLFAFLTQGGNLNWMPIIYALPLALNTEAILHSNNTRDMKEDSAAGIITFAILLGPNGSYIYFVFLLFTPFLIIIFLAFQSSAYFILAAVPIVFAFDYERQFRAGQLRSLPSQLAKLNLQIGLLFTMACYLTETTKLPGF